MKKRVSFTLITALGISLGASDSLESWFTEGKAYGKIKYYYIQTDKKFEDDPSTSAKASSIGGQLGYKTASWNGLWIKATFMTTNGFTLGNSVDTSILGRDRGVVCKANGGSDEECAKVAQESFSVLGEALIQYEDKNFSLNYGRQVVKTPLINAKEVRMLPSAVQAAFGSYRHKKTGLRVTLAYIDRFKQRTSDKFHDMYKHALGNMVYDITGKKSGDVYAGAIELAKGDWKLGVWDYFAPDFINSAFADAKYSYKIDEELSTSFAIETLLQNSIGNATSNLEKATSQTLGKSIKAQSFSMKAKLHYEQSDLLLAYSDVLDFSGKHDSLVLPWDGTPLYTNTITSNDLFQSNYEKALYADSAYIGGTKGFKVAYSQKYDFTGIKGFSTMLAYAQFQNSKFPKTQQDVNIVLGYKYKKFSLALKGIFVKNNTTANPDGSIAQIKNLNQYRAIATYKF